MWHITLLTLFPEMFPGFLGHSLAGRALEKGLWGFHTVDIRQFADDKHHTVDDTPYGGGAGMVMRADVLGKAIEASITPNTKCIYMSPRGAPLTQEKAYELSKTNNIAILCGRYEGIDQRVIDEYDIEELSIGDYILSGGEVAALTVMDACIRLLPGVIGNESTLFEESFSDNTDYAGLLEYPLYTRPLKWKNREVPSVLLSGHHANIEKWRLDEAKKITALRRSDLWKRYLEKNT